MDRNELMGHLQNYGSNINNRSATVNHYTDIKNKIREAYDAGNIDKELMKQLSDKASGAFKNMGRSPELSNLPNKILEKGGSVGSIEGMKSRFPSLDKNLSGNNSAVESLENVGKTVNEETGGLLRNKAGFSKVLPMLGLGATGLAALGIANKVQAGELGKASLDSADLVTDYIPGIAQAKMALRPSELGEEPTDPVSMKGSVFEKDYNDSVNDSPRDPAASTLSNKQLLLAPDDRVKKEDMDGILKNIRNKYSNQDQ